MGTLPSPQSQKAIVTEAAQRYGVRPDVLWGLYGTETGFGSNVKPSSAGAVGPFQFEPGTARDFGIDPNNFKQAAFGAARYLAQYKGRGIGGMLSAYNAGPAGGYQAGYVKTTLDNAKAYGGGVLPQLPPVPSQQGQSQETGFDQAGYKSAQTWADIGKLLRQAGGEKNPVLNLIPSKVNPADFAGGATVPSLPSTPSGGSKLGGFLPDSAPLQMKRIDQGQDIQTAPGQALIAPGDGEVVAVKSDPSGFGPDYPVVKFSSGPLAGKTIYLGHTDASLPRGAQFKLGQPIAHTSRAGHNAPPGWAEIGMASALGKGDMQAGQQIAPYLRKRG